MNTYIVLHTIVYVNITSYLFHCISLITSTMFVVIIYNVVKCIVDPHRLTDLQRQMRSIEKRTTGEGLDQWQKSSQPIDENMNYA